MSGFTFLDDDEIIGMNPLKIFKKLGNRASMTDFSVLLGILNFNSGIKYCSYWTKSKSLGGSVKSIDGINGALMSVNETNRSIGARPVINYSLIKNGAKEVGKRKGIKIVEYGEYPQMLENDTMAGHLENIYKNGTLKQTGKIYTTDSTYSNDNTAPFKENKFIEYEALNYKYIRFVPDMYCFGKRLANGKILAPCSAYWIKVLPLRWLVDEENNIALSENVIFSGIQFCDKPNYDGNFYKTNIKKFMDNYFSKEIVNNVVHEEVVEEKEYNSNLRKQNPYNFKFNEVSEEDIIKSMVESNVAVFLHGRSSEGKSARVKQLDPDLEIVYLRNVTPDSLNGKSVYNSESGEMIDVAPTWYKKLKAKCEAEKDKLHILFFDEITNALPSIQGMAFNIILDKEVNGIWKLPDNCRIVAAGNDIDDSLAANQLAEPLFNRFAHVYIETKVNDWLNWAITSEEEYERLDNEENKEKRMKIHPSIYAFIAYKGEKALRSKFTGNKPNADPRKWELASKVLYKSNNPYTLRALVGSDITKEFAEFCKIDVITLEDVLSGNYSEEDLKMNVSEKYATTVGLSMCEEKDILVVRNFVSKLGKEILATFDSLWCHGDSRRLEKLTQLNNGEDLYNDKNINMKDRNK